MPSSRGPDEFYTPPENVEPIIPYLDKSHTIYEPFRGKRHMVKALRAHGLRVIHGKDFFNKKPKKKYDLVVSNPPYSLHNEVLAELFRRDTPFLLLLPLSTVESIPRCQLYREKKVSLLFPERRLWFYRKKKKIRPNFHTVWVAYKVSTIGENKVIWL